MDAGQETCFYPMVGCLQKVELSFAKTIIVAGVESNSIETTALSVC
jgi:hypothetical protein